jgi:hypothetical protein
MGFGKSFKKAWKKTLGWTDDSWMTDAVIPAALAIGGAVADGPMAAMAAAGTYQTARGSHLQQKQNEQQLAMQRDIANRQAAAAAVPVATSVAKQQVVDATTTESNYATARRRAFSTADTITSGRLQRWASNGKRKTL